MGRMRLQVENLCFAYGDTEILKSVSFTAQSGQLVSVLGPNGVGKSTLFRCMLGLLRPSRGRAQIAGEDFSKNLFRLPAAELARWIAYLPQAHAPAFHFTVFDTVLMGTTAQTGLFASPGTAQKKQALQALEYLGIAHLKDRGYRNISGGEQQLVRLARAIAQQARILVMDEPSANLDFGNRLRVLQTARKLADGGYAVIQSTHDPDQAYRYSDRILALHAGEVLAWGRPQETICAPVLSRLYGVDVEVCSLQQDRIRVCVPVEGKGQGENRKESLL